MLKFRIDVVGLSNGDKPSTQIKNGTTYYEVDTGDLYIYYGGEWYKQGDDSSEEEETPSEPVENNRKSNNIEDEEINPEDNHD